MVEQLWTTLGLGLVLLAVLLAPFLSRKIERNLEAFFFVMGIVAASISRIWDGHLVKEALVEPVKITLAVLFAGLFFHLFRGNLDSLVRKALGKVSLGAIAFILVFLLGFSSSIISAIIASLILVEVVSLLPLGRRAKVNITVVTCFAIGIGAALTPLGEPLSTIAISKLKGEPYHASFFFLVPILAVYVVPGVLALALISRFFLKGKEKQGAEVLSVANEEGLKGVATRALRVYVFVMALVLLGSGFQLLIKWYLVKVPGEGLYWVNMSSAILDNATLTAAEIGPALSAFQIKSALVSLLISGGMLIPGNIPNIIAAHKLGIGSREWAKLGVPLGLILMVLYFPFVYLSKVF